MHEPAVSNATRRRKRARSTWTGPDDDASLVAAYRAGDHDAFAVLFRRYRGSHTAFARRMLSSHEEAEEVCVEAFTRVIEGAWRPVGSFEAFLFLVVRRLCLDRLKSRERFRRVTSRLVHEGHHDPSPEEVVLARDRQLGIDAVLGRLPPAHRDAVRLFYVEALPSREVARRLGCSDQQVRSRLSYSRRVLRAELARTMGAA